MGTAQLRFGKTVMMTTLITMTAVTNFVSLRKDGLVQVRNALRFMGMVIDQKLNNAMTEIQIQRTDAARQELLNTFTTVMRKTEQIKNVRS